MKRISYHFSYFTPTDGFLLADHVPIEFSFFFFSYRLNINTVLSSVTVSSCKIMILSATTFETGNIAE